MNQTHENRYKMSRNNAKLTQEQAAELLGVSTRSLCDYEAGKTRVPDDIVATMAKIYKCPLLAWRHLRETSILGKYLPDVVLPETTWEMAFQLVLANDDLGPTVAAIKKILANGKVDDHDRGDFRDSIELIKQVNAKLLTFIVYADKVA